MQKMQSMIFKIMAVIVMGIAIVPHNSYSQKLSEGIVIADSLFEQKKYTQSYELYDSLYTIEKVSSPAMLLKMAYIKEGLGDYTQALHFLYEYYILTSDELALEKMETLASARNLKGYNYADSEYILSVYHEYYDEIVIALLSFFTVFLAGLLYQRFKKHEKPTANFVMMAFFAILSVVVLQVGMGYQEAIIVHQNTYLMDAPSSSANVVAIVEKGHKIPLNGTSDVWYKTDWDNQEVFVKKKNLIPVNSW
jgi:uncharacterized protein YgiM (DUF1202 family)